MSLQQARKMEVVYDGRCPLCRTYCEAVRPDDPGLALELVDARRDSAAMEEVNRLGLDIDKGMVVRVDGRLAYGAEAMHEIALHARAHGWTAWLNRWFFATRRAAGIFYPAASTVRGIVLRLLGIPPVHNLKPKNTLKHQLGADWAKLHPNVQARFDREPAVGETITYQGTMDVIRRSRAGWLFATLTRVIGNPLTPFSGTNVPMEVALYRRDGRDGVFWRRTYFYPGRKPYVVVSTKQESKGGEMLECVGGGFGMKLKVSARDGEMHFESYRYFWTIFGFRLPLPHWISPGRAHVIHRDLGAGRFMFSISMVHPQLGETFYQRGVFSRKD